MLHSAFEARSLYTAEAPQHRHRIVVMGVVCPRWRHHRLMADGKRPIPLFQGIRPLVRVAPTAAQHDAGQNLPHVVDRLLANGQPLPLSGSMGFLAVEPLAVEP